MLFNTTRNIFFIIHLFVDMKHKAARRRTYSQVRETASAMMSKSSIYNKVCRKAKKNVKDWLFRFALPRSIDRIDPHHCPIRFLKNSKNDLTVSYIGLMQKYPPIFFLFYVSSFY